MGGALAKTKYYFNEYLNRPGWIKMLIGPVILCLIIANYLEIQYTNYTAQMTSKGGSSELKYSLLQWYIALFVLCYSLKFLVNLFNANFIANSIRLGFKNFFYEFFTVQYAVFQNIGIGEAQYTIMRRAYALSDFLTTFTMSFISNLFFFLIVLQSVNASIHGWVRLAMSLGLLAFLTFSVSMQLLRSRFRRRVNDGLQENSRKLYDILFNYERIVAYDNLDAELEKYWDSMHGQTVYGALYWVTNEAVGFLNSLFFVLLNVFLLLQFNVMGTKGEAQLKQFVMLIAKLREKLTDISKNLEEICTSFTNLDQSLIEGAAKDEGSGALSISAFQDAIEIRDMAFRYDGKLVFEHVNYTAPRGRKIAITGVNGAGKSTFVKILLGFYEYDGDILIDGIECRRLTKRCLRSLISYVPQNSFLFDGTVRDNLALANREIPNAKLVEYCKLYRMHKSLKKVGYDADVGERGMNLSGGQKQKISFMRSVIKNSPILILDEATSNMDSASELKLINSITENMRNKTVFMIIHNLSLLSHFDEVLFFDENTLKEHGPFEELQKSNGGFSRFYGESVKTFA
ncbi:ATP-binding cassette, subfamily B, heavy metal transporter [Pancytospora philotis]|nr:ATP-binding cassette, subfamily B, heavy metal transporter [Pancytospora philotis]